MKFMREGIDSQQDTFTVIKFQAVILAKIEGFLRIEPLLEPDFFPAEAFKFLEDGDSVIRFGGQNQ